MSISRESTTRNPAATRQKLIAATVGLILRQGFTASTVEQICAGAGVTKGSFFHHFASKEAIGLAAADWWGAMGTSMYAPAWADATQDPLEQLHCFFDIMNSFTMDPDQPCVCVIGMLSQEMSGTHPAFQTACGGHLADWTAPVENMLTAAKLKYPTATDFDPTQVAWFLNSLWQGSMLISKTRQSPEMIRNNIQLARNWVDGFFKN